MKTFKIFVILFLFLLALAPYAWSTEYSSAILNSTVHKSADLYKRVKQYKSTIENINEQIKGVMDEMDWLYLNMERIKDSERKVPYSFFRSIKEKKYNIRRLQKERDRYYKLVESFLSEIDSRKQKIEKYSIKRSAIKEGRIQESAIQDKEESAEKNGIDKSQLFYEIKKAGLSDWIDISDTGECLKLKTTLPILFPVGSAEIAKEYRSFFMKFANLLKTYDVQILVNGYADIDSINTKKYPSNFELGAIRAANVVHEFIKNGLKPSIFKINSPGKYRFSASGEPTQKALERRAEVTVIFVS